MAGMIIQPHRIMGWGVPSVRGAVAVEYVAPRGGGVFQLRQKPVVGEVAGDHHGVDVLVAVPEKPFRNWEAEAMSVRRRSLIAAKRRKGEESFIGFQSRHGDRPAGNPCQYAGRIALSRSVR